MGRKATQDEAIRINEILEQVHFVSGSPVFGTMWAEAKALCKAVSGYRPPSNCSACRHGVHDRLRQSVGLGIARRPDENLRAERLAVCHACPAYHASTGSCGRLVIDAISSKPVEIDGETVYPCGCVVALKASFQSEQCPANRWPK